MADRQFDPLGTVPSPADWTLPPSLQVLLKNIYASFDGTGAAAAFLPCVEIISDSGHTVGTYPTSTQVAAGASADTTWFPHVSGGGGGSAGLAWALYTGEDPSIVPAPPSVGHIILGDPNNAGAFVTSDASVFGLALNESAVQSVQIKAPGVYLLHAMVQGTFTTLPGSGNVLVTYFEDPRNFPIGAPAQGIYRSRPGSTSGLINLQPSTIVTVPDGTQGTPAVYGLAAQQTTALANPTLTARVFAVQVSTTGATLH